MTFSRIWRAEAAIRLLSRLSLEGEELGSNVLHCRNTAVPYTIHIVLTDNGIQFGDMMVAVSAVAHIATGAFWR
jgi:hypothetical protein